VCERERRERGRRDHARVMCDKRRSDDGRLIKKIFLKPKIVFKDDDDDDIVLLLDIFTTYSSNP